MRKIKLLLSTIALFAFLNTANAQNIEQEITSFLDETEVLINNGRRMMLRYVQARNFGRVAEIYHLLNERTNAENCVPFTLSEDLLITVLTNSWDDFFAIAEHFSDIAGLYLCVPIHDYSLFMALQSEVENNAAQLIENALATGLTLEEKHLLALYFYMIEHGTDDAYRQKLRAFRREHSQSVYNDFVRNYFPRAPLRLAIGFNVGATQVFPMGGFSDYFSSPTAFNFTLDVKFNRFLLGLQADIGSMRLNAPLLSSATGYEYDFQAGDRFEFVNLSFPIGYTVIRNNRFELTPYTSIGLTDLISTMHPRTDEGSLDRNREFTVVSSFSVGAGVRTEFQFARIDIMNFNFRFDAGYSRPIRFRYMPARGNIFYARAGIVWWFGSP